MLRKYLLLSIFCAASACRAPALSPRPTRASFYGDGSIYGSDDTNQDTYGSIYGTQDDDLYRGMILEDDYYDYGKEYYSEGYYKEGYGEGW